MTIQWMVISAERPQRKRRAGDQDCGGADRTEAGHGAADFAGACLRFIGGNPNLNFGIDGAQLPFDQRQASAALLDRKGDLLGLVRFARAGLIPDQSLARDLQLFEFAHGVRYWRLWGQVQRRAHLRQNP